MVALRSARLIGVQGVMLLSTPETGSDRPDLVSRFLVGSIAAAEAVSQSLMPGS